MSLEKVLDQIRQDGKQKADRIRRDGNAEADRIRREAREEIEKRKAHMEAELSEKTQHMLEIRLSKQRMEGKRKRLTVEKRLLEEFKTALEESVRTIDYEQNKALLRKLLNIAHASPAFSIQSLVAKEEEEAKYHERPFYLYCCERDQELTKELSDLEVADTIDCLGGLIAEAEDQSWRINLTYDVLLEHFYEHSLKKIHGLLMGEPEDG